MIDWPLRSFGGFRLFRRLPNWETSIGQSAEHNLSPPISNRVFVQHRQRSWTSVACYPSDLVDIRVI